MHHVMPRPLHDAGARMASLPVEVRGYHVPCSEAYSLIAVSCSGVNLSTFLLALHFPL